MNPLPLEIDIVPLCRVPRHLGAAASLIHHEFWAGVSGASVAGMAARLAGANSTDRLPLCLVALHGDAPAGVVNLVESDEPNPTDWGPWLAGLVVTAAWRGRGVGRALVQALLDDARRLAVRHVYLGTDGPGFYARLGAHVHAQPRPEFWFMRFDLVPRNQGPSSVTARA